MARPSAATHRTIAERNEKETKKGNGRAHRVLVFFFRLLLFLSAPLSLFLAAFLVTKARCSVFAVQGTWLSQFTGGCPWIPTDSILGDDTASFKSPRLSASEV
jgi:hypothetical protein